MQTINLDLPTANNLLSDVAENETFDVTISYRGGRLIARGRFNDDGMYELNSKACLVRDGESTMAKVDEEDMQYFIDVALGNVAPEEDEWSAGDIDGDDFAYGGRIRGGSVYSLV